MCAATYLPSPFACSCRFSSSCFRLMSLRMLVPTMKANAAAISAAATMRWPCHKYHAAPRGSATRNAALAFWPPPASGLASPSWPRSGQSLETRRTAWQSPGCRACRAPKGWGGGPGRPAGQRNRLTETVTTFLSEDFELHGRDVIETVRTKHPQIYLSACVSLLPKQQTVEKISPLGHLTDEKLDQLERFLTASRAQQVTKICLRLQMCPCFLHSRAVIS
jgi:hypothetical protein